MGETPRAKSDQPSSARRRPQADAAGAGDALGFFAAVFFTAFFAEDFLAAAFFAGFLAGVFAILSAS
jgi:hypothetical protein